MKFTEYLASKAVNLCFYAIGAVIWGVYAYLAGATAALLWTTVGAFILAVILRLTLGYAAVNSKLKKLSRIKDNLTEKYLLGEILPAPYDAVQKEYFEIMKEVSRSAVGEVEKIKREKEDYFNSVEKWIHEIKTPLTACALICDNGGDTGKLRRELKKADNCTDTILQYARLRSPENDTAITKISAAEVIADAVLSQRELLIAAKIGVTCDGDFCVYTDGKAVCFILKQLFINCAKYCGGCSIKVTAENGVITVADNGAGIAAHDLPRIFDRGFTGASGKGAGTGMGLYIVKELCNRLNIEITATSALGEGTAFYLKFPQYKV